MDEEDVAHLAGVLDAVGTLSADVSQADTPVGYRLEPVVRIRRPASDRALLGKLAAYCEENGVRYDMSGGTGESDPAVLEIRHPASVRAFLDPLVPYLASVRQEAMIVLEKIVPAVVEDDPLTKREFHRLVGYADRIRATDRSGTDPEYTQEFFAELWYDELRDEP